ncbi:uncharacterized protein N7511_006245 [Penicillium nucicola]|uniref:uncharacterized protein n=1 Tax=Penicillium nucicola TaxID=1850975 RepID=UPI0025450884|nr:uncharacterized protein N7511_006245 [Penicillium nucicola]KAJ5757551.1 hypothetical protein N7511_006245 [Penicillium nucicola]
MAQESSTLIFFQRALAVALTITVCRQLGTFNTPLSLFLPSNVLTDTLDSLISATVATAALFFAWHIAGPLRTDSSTFFTASLNSSRSFLASIVLVFSLCEDSLFKRVILALAVGACWTLGWKVTVAEQRKSYWQFLRQALVLKVLELWQKGNF